MFQRILLATDGSENALKAAEVAVEQAKMFSALLIVLYVLPVPVQFAPYMGSPEMIVGQEGFFQYSEEMKQEIVRRTRQTLMSAEVPYDLRFADGNAADAIVRFAKEEDCDLIVLGNRGLTGLGSFFMGSVSNRVCDYAHCAVLVVK